MPDNVGRTCQNGAAHAALYSAFKMTVSCVQPHVTIKRDLYVHGVSAVWKVEVQRRRGLALSLLGQRACCSHWT